MLKGLNYWCTREGLAGTYPIDQAIRDAADAGFDTLELCIGREGVLTPSTTRETCDHIRDLASQAGIALTSLASGMSWALNPVSDDPEVRKQSLDDHRAALQRADWLGCDTLLYVPGVVTSPICPDEHVRYDHAMARAQENIAQLLEPAEQHRITIAIENVWNGFFYSPIELASFIDGFQSDHLGIYLDLGNLIGMHQHPPHWIELLASRIKRIHIKGFQHSFDWEGSYIFSQGLEGDVPWQACMDALNSIGYTGPLTAEVMPWSEGLLPRLSEEIKQMLGSSVNTTF